MGHKPERRAPSQMPANAALALNTENKKLRASMRELLDCYWGNGDGARPPEFIIKAAFLSGWKARLDPEMRKALREARLAAAKKRTNKIFEPM